MSWLACLGEEGTREAMFSEGAFLVVGAALLLAVALAAFASPLLRKAYRERVVRFMGLDQVAPRPEGWWRAMGGDAAAVPGAAGGDVTVDALRAGARTRELRVLRATVVAWAAFMAVGIFVLGQVVAGAHWADRVEFAAWAGMLALGPALVNLPRRWRRPGLVAGVALTVAALVLTGVIHPDDEPWAEDDWIGLVAAPFLLWVYAALFGPRLRGVVFPAALVGWVTVLAFVLPLGWVEPRLGACLELAQAPEFVASGVGSAWSGALTTVGAGLFVLGLWLGFQALAGLARAIERGWLGELSVVALVGLAVIAAAFVFGAAPEEGGTGAATPWWPVLWVGAAAAAYALALGRSPRAPGCPLLLLRVFSRDRRQHALLEAVQDRWRYVGAIQQAGGPDLVDLNIDPYECAMFLSGRLYDLFLPEAVSAEQLAGRFNYAQDREGRFRINEMFNFNTAWRQNVERLIEMSPTILLDVRGLTAEREGTAFEVGLIARLGVTDRVVAVGDGTTDWDQVAARLAEHGRRPEDMPRIDADAPGALDAIHEALLAKASGLAPGAAS